MLAVGAWPHQPVPAGGGSMTGILEGICLYTDEIAGFLNTTRALNSEFVRLVRQLR